MVNVMFSSNVLLRIKFLGTRILDLCFLILCIFCHWLLLESKTNATWWFSHRMLWVKICSVFVVRPFCRRSSHTSWAHMTDTTNIHYFIQNPYQKKSWLLGGRDFNHFNLPAVSIDVFFFLPQLQEEDEECRGIFMAPAMLIREFFRLAMPCQCWFINDAPRWADYSHDENKCLCLKMGYIPNEIAI